MPTIGLRTLILTSFLTLLTPSIGSANQCRHLFEKTHRTTSPKDRLLTLFGGKSGVHFYDYTLTNGHFREGRKEDQWLPARDLTFPKDGILAVEIVRTDVAHIIRFKFFENFDSLGPHFKQEMVLHFDPLTSVILPPRRQTNHFQESSIISHHTADNSNSLRVLTQITRGPAPNLLNVSMFGVIENDFSSSEYTPNALEWVQSYQEEFYTDKGLYQRKGVRILELTPMGLGDPEMIQIYSSLYYDDQRP